MIVAASFALLLIGFSQTAGDARAFATRHKYRIDVNQESVAQGMANVGAGVFQGIPVSTSLSASSLNESAGARTPVASLVTGALVLATLIVLAPAFADLPKAVLGAIIIDAVVFGMIDVPEMRRLYRVTRFDFWIAVAAIVGVLSFGVLAGVLIGVVLSLGWLIYVATRPAMPLLGRQRGTHVFRELDEQADDETFPGIAVLRLDADCSSRRQRHSRTACATLWTRHAAARAPSCSTSKGSISSIRREPSKLDRDPRARREPGRDLRLARVKPSVLGVLRADGFIERLGAGHIHGNVHRAVEAQVRR